MRPLDGVLVIAIEQAVAAPFATRQLADLGARVIKIERPDGGDFARQYDATVKGESSYFVWLNRSKESLTLDLKRPAARDALAALLDRADVFVQNLAPGAAARLGTDAPALHARYPRLIVCDVTGYGTTGPYADKKAYDLLVQAEAGLIAITGTPDHPSKVGISVADISAGMYAYSGILAALLTRAQTGRGAIVDVSLFDSLAEWMSPQALYTEHGGREPARSGASHASIAPYGPFTCQGGDVVFLGIQNAREWTRFCADVLGDPALERDARFATNPLRVSNRDALTAAIERVFLTLTAADVEARLASADIACARQRSMKDFARHPQLSGRDRWHSIATPGGDVNVLAPPTRVSGITPVMGPVPTLGQHTDTILEELGFDSQTIATWRKDGTIA